jgi:mono/diheme cytochrome c family protein
MSDRLSQPPGSSPDQPAPGAAPPHVTAASRRSGGPAAFIARGLANLLAAGVLVYLTYFFTMFFAHRPPAPAPMAVVASKLHHMFFAHRPPAPAPVSEEVRIAAKKVEELRAEDRKLLSSYGEVDPVTKTLRIPVDRAMELYVDEGATPTPAFTFAPAAVPAAAQPGPATPAPKPEPKPDAVAAKPATATFKPDTVAAKAATPAPAAPAAPTSAPTPAPAPAAVAALPPPGAARGGFTQKQLYGFVCQSCHDADAKGGIGRKSPELGMALIPDFTDPKWQLSRTNADFVHSMLEGKGQGMKPVKDKLELAKLQPDEMAAFIRSFSPTTVAATSAAPAPAAEPKPAAPAVASAATPKPVEPTSPAPAPTRPAEAKPAEPKPAATAVASASIPKPATPEPIKPAAAPVTTAAAPAPAAAPEPEALTPEQMKLLAFLASPAPGASATAGSAEARPKEPTVPPETVSFFMLNCMACHGLDGRGMSAARATFPQLPDFTAKEFHLERSNPQLKVSILDGKGTFMPPWRGKLTPELAASLATYVRGFGPPGLFATPAAPASEFAKSFDTLQKEWDALDAQLKSLSRR